jgi:hypothetical protein
LLVDDSDPESQDDVAEIESSFWVVQCSLVRVQSPGEDISAISYSREDGRREVKRLLLGTTVTSPTIPSDDPGPAAMPHHPFSARALVAAHTIMRHYNPPKNWVKIDSVRLTLSTEPEMTRWQLELVAQSRLEVHVHVGG